MIDDSTNIRRHDQRVEWMGGHALGKKGQRLTITGVEGLVSEIRSPRGPRSLVWTYPRVCESVVEIENRWPIKCFLFIILSLE